VRNVLSIKSDYSKAMCRRLSLNGMIAMLSQVWLFGEPRGIPSYVQQFVVKKKPGSQSWPLWIFFCRRLHAQNLRAANPKNGRTACLFEYREFVPGS